MDKRAPRLTAITPSLIKQGTGAVGGVAPVEASSWQYKHTITAGSFDDGLKTHIPRDNASKYFFTAICVHNDYTIKFSLLCALWKKKGKKITTFIPQRQTVADCCSDLHCEEFLLGSLFFVVVLVTDVSTVTAKSAEENKFCVEMNNIEFPVLHLWKNCLQQRCRIG